MEAQLGTLYRVVITEYDAGVQRLAPCDTKLFTTLESAEYYKELWEKGGNHEWSWRGEITVFG
jgi:hypothetical protein